MYESAAETWREWGRSLALADVTPAPWQAADLAVVWLTMALPVLRTLAGRPTRVDLALLAVRAALLGPLAGAYARRGVPFWLSPLADPATALRLTLSALRPGADLARPDVLSVAASRATTHAGRSSTCRAVKRSTAHPSPVRSASRARSRSNAARL